MFHRSQGLPQPAPPLAGLGEEDGTIRIGDLPQLRLIAWNMDPDMRLTAERLILTAWNGVLHI